jgi:hypothetical protein
VEKWGHFGKEDKKRLDKIRSVGFVWTVAVFCCRINGFCGEYGAKLVGMNLWFFGVFKVGGLVESLDDLA